VDILTEKRAQLEQVAEYLLEHETMDAAAFAAVFAEEPA
jgi:ATP-dependent Zn protease